MYVEFGNTRPTALKADGNPFDAPTVTRCDPLSDDPENGYSPHESAEHLANKLARHLASAPGVTRVGDISDGTGHHEAFLTAVASWRQESSGAPTWVDSDNHDFAVLLGHFFDCPVGRPNDVEDTHYTQAGAPGVRPPVDEEAAE